MNTETDRDCQRAADLIPWVAGRTAAADDKAWLYLHVVGCARCRTDLTRALALSARVHAAADSLPVAPDALWHKITAAEPALLPPAMLAEDTAAAAVAAAPNPEQRATFLLGKALGLLDLAGLPRVASAQLQWALSWV